MTERVLTLDTDGAELSRHFVDESALADLEKIIKPIETGRAGVRLNHNPHLSDWLTSSGVEALASRASKARVFPVRAILFDKSPTQNWSLYWHQDRTIAVRQKADVSGFGPWGSKAGITHVEPPFEIIEAMLTVRIHIDPVPSENAPLRIAPGSHRFGKIRETEIEAMVQRCGTHICLADAGDVWLYRTAVLHASSVSKSAVHRRVLQIDFASAGLPPPLEWLGVA